MMIGDENYFERDEKEKYLAVYILNHYFPPSIQQKNLSSLTVH